MAQLGWRPGWVLLVMFLVFPSIVVGPGCPVWCATLSGMLHSMRLLSLRLVLFFLFDKDYARLREYHSRAPFLRLLHLSLCPARFPADFCRLRALDIAGPNVDSP